MRKRFFEKPILDLSRERLAGIRRCIRVVLIRAHGAKTVASGTSQ